MKNLLNFILKYHYVILFIILEGISLSLLVQFNSFQRSSFLNSSNLISSRTYKVSHSIKQYFGLKDKNIELNQALADLYSKNDILYKSNKITPENILDTIILQQFSLIPGVVINNSTNRQNNYITLNIGSNQGVEKEMAVIGPSGIVGVVKSVSNNFSSVVSILNQNLRTSAMIKKNGYFGSLLWDGTDDKYSTLIDLPDHINVEIGDTIITSGYSAMFPKGYNIGTVSEIENVSGDFFKIQVKLSTNFSNISNIMVVKNLLRNEQLKLEGRYTND